jgi:hypothetical protein
MKLDPSTGPIPREQFKEIADAPFGEATKIIREYDPQWGRAPGEKFEWKITVQRKGSDCGTAIIKAASEQEANEAADALSEFDIDWDCGEGFDVVAVEPNVKRK